MKKQSASSTAGFAILVAALATACASTTPRSEQVDSDPPSVTYEYETDTGLLQANAKAREYCAQYASTPTLQGRITDENKVTFECLKTAPVSSGPDVHVHRRTVVTPTGYVYRTDAELLTAIQSADAYCERSGETASTEIVTHPDGTKTLTFRCVPS